MKKVNRVGETNIATNGQKMTIIAYRNYNDIDIQFEDRTIVYHKSYDKFKKGIIKNPNYNPQFLENRIGEISLSKNGQKMKIIAYRSAADIDVQFEDGTIVYNKSYNNFKKGYISNPNYSRIGEKRKANNCQWMEIIEWFAYKNITVKFEDGTVVKNRAYGCFKKGEIANPNYRKRPSRLINRIGEKRKANNGQKMTIIAYRNCKDIDIQFEDGTIVYNKCYREFKKGNIGNPNYKIAVGISCNEFAIYYYLKKYGFIKKEQGSLKDLGFGRMELDCYHPDYKIAIEYDGDRHETIINKDKL